MDPEHHNASTYLLISTCVQQASYFCRARLSLHELVRHSWSVLRLRNMRDFTALSTEDCCFLLCSLLGDGRCENEYVCLDCTSLHWIQLGDVLWTFDGSNHSACNAIVFIYSTFMTNHIIHQRHALLRVSLKLPHRFLGLKDMLSEPE